MTTRSEPLVEALSALTCQHPFFASLLYDLLEVVETDTLPGCGGAENKTAATDGKTIFVNPQFMAKLTPQERVFVLAHEIVHVISDHPARMKQYSERAFGPDLQPFSNGKFNRASDYVNNAMLVENGIGKMPVGALFHPDFNGNDIVDEVYCKIPDDPEDNNPNGGNQWDKHLPGSQNGPSKVQVQQAMKAAAQAAKTQGNLPGVFQRLVDNLCDPEVSWQDYLRKAIVSLHGVDQQTWARPNRRKLAVPPHVYWPGRTGTQSEPIAVAIDTSGSISDKELNVFLSELTGILSDVQPEVVHAMYIDSQLYNDEVIEITDISELDTLRAKAGGGGGTDMTVVFREIEERQIAVGSVVIFTDGYTPFGEDTGIPTVWCITTPSIEAPWGTTVHVKTNQ